jgi:hypothetical protein
MVRELSVVPRSFRGVSRLQSVWWGIQRRGGTTPAQGSVMTDGGAMGETIEGAAPDWTVSSDAMRWSPLPAGADYPGVDCGTGIAEAVRPHVRRLAARAVAPFAEVAVDMLDELRGLRRPRRWGRATPARP